MGFNFFRPLRAWLGILYAAAPETEFLSLAMIKNVYYRRQQQHLWSVFIKLAPWLAAAETRFVSFGRSAKLCCVPLANIPCFFSRLAPVEKANARDSTYVRPGCSFFTPAASFWAVTNG
jgi:hypothetical protein